jgi:integrase/recombinase XerD
MNRTKAGISSMELIDRSGKRLYLTNAERKAFLQAAEQSPPKVMTFCLVLHFTGCRISEALALTPEHFDFGGQSIIFETLKKRRSGVFRAVPVPKTVLDTIATVHGLRKIRRPAKRQPLWDWSRMTAYRRIVEIMEKAGIDDGPHKCPKGLRHGYGVHAINSGIPLNMLSRWMGHSSLEITAIYANALGEEQRQIASRMWE